MTTQEIILSLLEEKGMTKAELARKVGMAQPNLSRLLNGNSQIRQSTLEKIRIALDVAMEELKRFQFAEAPEDDASPIGRLVVGYIDYKGKVIRCNDFNELKKNVIALEQEITAIEREREKIARKNKANKKVVDVSSSPNFSEIDLKSVKTIDCSKQRVWAFRKSEDVVKNEEEEVENKLGNMAACKFKVTIDNDEYIFSNSEALYICGMFSHNTAEHNEIQKALFEEKSGYSAKKNVRRKNEDKKRADWNDFNVEWMKWVILQKVQGSAEFRDLLLKIPSNAIIVENSTFQQKKENDTSAFWGARNEELKTATKTVENYIDFTHPYEKKAITDRLKMKVRNELQYIGKYVGVNCMGGILKMAQLYLLNGTPMPIDYDLLNSKYIHLFGHLLQFKKTEETAIKFGNSKGELYFDETQDRYPEQMFNKSECILFNSYAKGEAKVLSNMYPCYLNVNGHNFNSAEQLFLTLWMFKHPHYQEKLHVNIDPHKILNRLHGYEKTLWRQFDNGKLAEEPMIRREMHGWYHNVVLFCMRVKYKQCKEYREFLLKHPTETLVEYTHWKTDFSSSGGVDVDSNNVGNWHVGELKGCNSIGVCTMIVRDEGMKGLLDGEIPFPYDDVTLFGEKIIPVI